MQFVYYGGPLTAMNAVLAIIGAIPEFFLFKNNT